MTSDPYQKCGLKYSTMRIELFLHDYHIYIFDDYQTIRFQANLIKGFPFKYPKSNFIKL